MTRRSLLAAAAGAVLAGSPRAARYATPYKYGKLVLAASEQRGAFDSRAVDCPFVFEHGGSFYMAYVGFDGTGYQTGLARSRDLVRWQRLGCILRRDPTSDVTRYNVAMNWIVRETGLRSPGRLEKAGGQFLGVFHAYPNAGYESGPAVIGLCRSSDLMNWRIGDIVLRPEDGAEWERGGLYKPCLLRHGGTFYLFYNAKTPERRWHEQIGVATSTDLERWTRHPGNPIVRNGGAGSWDERFASDPCVLIDGARWAFFYYGLDREGRARDLLATGSGPYDPVKAGAILVDAGAPGSVDETYAHKPSVVWHDGALYHFYCAVSGRYPNEVRGISVARSRPWKDTG